MLSFPLAFNMAVISYLPSGICYPQSAACNPPPRCLFITKIRLFGSYSFYLKRLPLQPVSSERNHQVADKFRKMSCLNVYGQKRGRVSVQTMHAFLRSFVKFFFHDYMSKLFPIFYLANFVCFYPSKYKAFPPNINYIFLILPYTK